MSADALRVYVREHFHQVPGWAGTAASVLLLEALAGIQEGCEPYGGFEIGVHQGRYLIALHCASALGTRSLGVDLFDDQERNVDASGKGDIQAARKNIDAFAREPQLVDLMTADSLTLTSSDLDSFRSEYGGFRFASVDGGHTPAHVVSDLTTATQVTVPGGFIILDDFFNNQFPGVTEGFYAASRDHVIPWVPLLVTNKKLFMCHVSFQPIYWDRLEAVVAEHATEHARPKTVNLAGHRTVSLAI